MTGLIESNPNATVSAIGAAIAALILYLLSQFAGVELSAYYATLLAGAVSSGLLLLGREGLSGVLHLILHGGGSSQPPTPPPTSK